MIVRAWVRRYRWIWLLGLLCLLGLVCVAAPRLIWLRRAIQRMDEATARAAETIGQPASNWQTTDLEGTRRTLAEYRGKVVVLDFWFSSCNWCMRSMPQVVALAEEFVDQNVVVLGVNSDENVDDAMRVVEHFKFPYSTLKSTNEGNCLDETYRVSMWPTAVILDQEGVVRHVHCGYWPTMGHSMANEIRALLAAKSTKSQGQDKMEGNQN